MPGTPDVPAPPRIHVLLRPLVRLLFAVYHDIRIEGAEHVPASGPVIIASNHPTYLDPAFLMLGLGRPVRFMAWEKPFRIPLLGSFMRAYGAVPVDMKKPGKDSFAAAVRLLRGGEAFGIFPEGGRTRRGELTKPFKSGVARLAVMTAAPIVPVTISGGGRVWPKHQFLPRPGPIRVTFHEPIRVAAAERARWRRDRGLEEQVIGRVLDSIHSTLRPSRRAEQRVERLLRAHPKPPGLWIEGIPFFFFAAGRWFMSADVWWRYAAPAIPALLLLLAVLVAEQLWSAAPWVTEAALRFGAGHRTLKAARNFGPWVVIFCLGCAAREVVARWELALAAAGLAALMWIQLFRFSSYRRVRVAALMLAYVLWLLRLRAVS